MYAQNSIICQFGPRNLSSVQQLISPSILVHFGGNCINDEEYNEDIEDENDWQAVVDMIVPEPAIPEADEPNTGDPDPVPNDQHMNEEPEENHDAPMENPHLQEVTVESTGVDKRHHLASYHRVREAIAAKFISFHWKDGKSNPADILSKHWEFATVWPMLKPILFWRGKTATQLKGSDRIPSTTPGAEPPRDAKDSGSARSHSTHLETSSSNQP